MIEQPLSTDSHIAVTHHGTMANRLDHRDVYPPLCTVLIEVADVFGNASRDQIWVDIHEDWLEPA